MKVTPDTPLVLGSGSPRRREILSGLGIPVVTVPPVVDETRRVGESPERYLDRVVRDKLEDVATRSGSSPGILVADTIVVVDDDILGKPADLAEARMLLRRIAGRDHAVSTRYAISSGSDPRTPRVKRTVTSMVTIRPLTDDEIARYAATREGIDKAGAYAAQGIGGFLVARIAGSYSGVVGLPACEVVADLVEMGLLEGYPLASGA